MISMSFISGILTLAVTIKYMEQGSSEYALEYNRVLKKVTACPVLLTILLGIVALATGFHEGFGFVALCLIVVSNIIGYLYFLM